MLEEQNIADVVCKKLGMPCGKPDLTDWIDVVNRERALSKKVEIAIVGKYVELHDAYLSTDFRPDVRRKSRQYLLSGADRSQYP